MEFGECAFDFDIIDVAERSPLTCFQKREQRRNSDEGLKTSKSWCGPVHSLIGKNILVVSISKPEK